MTGQFVGHTHARGLPYISIVPTTRTPSLPLYVRRATTDSAILNVSIFLLLVCYLACLPHTAHQLNLQNPSLSPLSLVVGVFGIPRAIDNLPTRFTHIYNGRTRQILQQHASYQTRVILLLQLCLMAGYSRFHPRPPSPH